MFDTGLSRTGLDRDWAKSAGATSLADTGATAVLRSLRLGDLRLDDYPTALYPLAGLSEAGELHGTIVRLQQLELGRLRVTSPTTGLGSENKGFLGRTDIDGVIGNAVFEGSRLIVDYARRRVIIEPRVAGGSLCDYDMSGLRLVARGPALRRVVVDYVVPGSPSADVGIRAGGEVLLSDVPGVGE